MPESNWSIKNIEVFKTKVLPEWAETAIKYKFDVNNLTPDEKKKILTLFREFWEQSPPF